MIEVLTYSWEFPPCISGGLGVACHGIVSALAKTNQVNNFVLLPGTHKQIEKIDAIANAYFYNIDIASHSDESISAYANSHHTDVFNSILKYALLAFQKGKQFNFDIIHCHDWMTVLAGINMKNHSQKPLVFHVHSIESDRSYIEPNKTIYEIEQYGMQEADSIIAVSEYTKQCIIRDYHIDEHKIEVIYNGIAHIGSTNHHKNSEFKKISFLGRLTEQKSPHTFVDIAIKCLKNRDDLLFIIAGKGEQKEALEAHVSRYNLADKIKIINFLDREQIIQFLKTSDIFIMPSRSEPFGLVAAEAIMSGAATIISKQSGISEILPSIANANYYDIDCFVEHVEYYLSNPQEAQTIVHECQLTLRKYTWDHCVQQIITTYERLINNIKDNS